MLINGSLRTSLFGFAFMAGLASSASAQGLDEPFRGDYRKALEGKTVGYVPVAMSFDLAQGWLAGLKSGSAGGDDADLREAGRHRGPQSGRPNVRQASAKS
jgi:hypothetical protein